MKKLEFEGLMSGIRVLNYEEIKPISEQIETCWSYTISYKDLAQLTPKGAKYIMQHYNFYGNDTNFVTSFSPDEDYIIGIINNYPEYEEQLIKRFGEKWHNYYLRFGH